MQKTDEHPLFASFFLAGFECSDHRLEDGRRLDLLTSTRHVELADADYARMRALGMCVCREGVSWVHSERFTGEFDFSSALHRMQAAKRQGVSIIWDLLHFGWPADVDVFSARFVTRFGKYAAAFARFLSDHADAPPWIAPINEISFLAWAGGDVRCMNPFEAARGVELKSQLVLATIEAIEAVRAVWPRARFLQPEPIIHIVPRQEHPKTWRRVESDELLQYQTWDMLVGRVWPALGGHPKYLDVMGVNFYSDNQFMLDGSTIERGDPRYKPLSDMLQEVHARYDRPFMLAETGGEGEQRAPWLRYVADECVQALAAGCELHGVTWYPILNHQGWVDDRHCHNGLWDYADEAGAREPCVPLAEELIAQTPRLLEARDAMLRRRAERRADAATRTDLADGLV
jgi:hypothetical protein